MYFCRPRRRPHRGVQAGLGRRSATRSWSSAATGCGTATCTPTTSAPRSRSRSTSAGARTRSASPTCSRRSPRSTPSARPSRTADASQIRHGGRRRRRRGRPPAGHVRRRRGVQRRRAWPSCSPSSACRASSPAARPSTRRPPSCSTRCEHVNADAGRHPARTTRTSSRSPSRSMRSPTRPSSSCRPARCPRRFAALVVYDPEASADANATQMTEAAEAVATGEVTQAVRDTTSEAGPIADGRLDRHRPRRRHRRRRPPLVEGVRRRCSTTSSTPSREIVTIIRGSTPTPTTTTAIAWLARRRTRPTCRSRCTAAASRCTRTCSGWSDAQIDRAGDHAARPRRDRRRACCKGVGEREARRRSRRSASRPCSTCSRPIPRRWVDRTNEARIADLVPGEEALVLVTVRSVTQADRPATGARWSRPASATDRAGCRSSSSTSRGASGSSARGCRSRCSARPTRTAAGCR